MEKERKGWGDAEDTEDTEQREPCQVERVVQGPLEIANLGRKRAAAAKQGRGSKCSVAGDSISSSASRTSWWRKKITHSYVFKKL